MDIYIYFNLNYNIDLDEFEETIDEMLDVNGEVTGRGIGISGANIDIELYDNAILESFLEKLRTVGFPQDTYYVIDNTRYNLF